MGPGVPRKLEGHRRVSLCTTQYCLSSFDNYRDNSKTAYLASSTHTRARLEAKEKRTLTSKVPMLVGKTRVPPTIGLCFGPVKRNGISGRKPTIFMTRESAGFRPLRAGFLERRGREKPPRACPPYIRSQRSRQRPNPIMDSLRLREVLPVRQARRTQPAPRQTRRAIEEATRHRSRMGASVRRARVRSFVGGRMKRPLEPVLHNQDERARNGVVPESWMGLLSGAHARGFWCPAGRKDPRELVLFASCVRARQRRNRNRGPAWACRARVRLLVSGRMKTPGLNRRELEPPSGKLI